MSKHIVITGTSRGIGLSLSLLLAKQGHRVLALSRKPNKDLDKQANIEYLPFDLSAKEDFKKLDDFLKTKFQRVDILIHNAGFLVHKPFEALTRDDFMDSYQINVFGVAFLTQTCLPYMPKGSHVVTISSMGGVQGSGKFPGLAAYSSSKGAVITLCELLAEEYKSRGVAFNVLCLGAVQTEMLEEAFPGYQAPLTAEKMAEFIAYFSLNGQDYFNGKVLPVSSSNP